MYNMKFKQFRDIDEDKLPSISINLYRIVHLYTTKRAKSRLQLRFYCSFEQNQNTIGYSILLPGRHPTARKQM